MKPHSKPMAKPKAAAIPDSHLQVITQIFELLKSYKDVILDTSKANPTDFQRQQLLAGLEKLIRKNPNVTRSVVNYFNPTGKMAFLLYFAQENCHEMVDLLLQLRAPVDTAEQEKAGISALMRACEYADVNMVRKLLAAKAKTTLFNPLGFAPIHLADSLEKIQALVEYDKTGVNLKTKCGKTPLIVTILTTTEKNLANSEKIIRFLLEHNADILTQFLISSGHLGNALYAAVQQGFPSIIRLIHTFIQKHAAHFDVNIKLITSAMRTAHSTQKKKFDEIQILLQELGYLKEKLTYKEIRGLELIENKILTGEITLFSQLNQLLDTNLENRTELVACALEGQDILLPCIQKINRAISDTQEKPDLNELLELEKALKIYLDAIISQNPAAACIPVLKREYILIARKFYTENNIADRETISLKLLTNCLENIHFCKNLCGDDTENERFFFATQTSWVMVICDFSPQFLSEWVMEYLARQEDHPEHFRLPTVRYHIISLLTKYIARSSESVNQKVRYLEPLQALLTSFDNNTNTPDFVISTCNHARSVYLIVQSLFTQDSFHILRANKFCTEHSEIDFSKLQEWAEFQALLSSLNEKQKQPKKKSPVYSYHYQTPRRENPEVAFSETAPTDVLNPAEESSNPTAVSSSAHPADDSPNLPQPLQASFTESRPSSSTGLDITNNTNFDDSINGSSSSTGQRHNYNNASFPPSSDDGFNSSMGQHTNTLSCASYRTAKPARKTQRAEERNANNNNNNNVKDKILELFKLPADAKNNLILIDEIENRWGYFALTAEDFSDVKTYGRFYSEFTKGDPHFVKTKNHWAVTLAIKGLETRVFASEKIAHEGSQSWRLMCFDHIGPHDDYQNRRGNLFHNH